MMDDRREQGINRPKKVHTVHAEENAMSSHDENTGKCPRPSAPEAGEGRVGTGAEKDALDGGFKSRAPSILLPSYRAEQQPSPTQDEMNDSFCGETKPKGPHTEGDNRSGGHTPK